MQSPVNLYKMEFVGYHFEYCGIKIYKGIDDLGTSPRRHVVVLEGPISGKEVFLQTKDVSNFVAIELEWPLARTCSCCDRRN